MSRPVNTPFIAQIEMIERLHRESQYVTWMHHRRKSAHARRHADPSGAQYSARPSDLAQHPHQYMAAPQAFSGSAPSASIYPLHQPPHVYNHLSPDTQLYDRTSQLTARGGHVHVPHSSHVPQSCHVPHSYVPHHAPQQLAPPAASHHRPSPTLNRQFQPHLLPVSEHVYNIRSADSYNPQSSVYSSDPARPLPKPSLLSHPAPPGPGPTPLTPAVSHHHRPSLAHSSVPSLDPGPGSGPGPGTTPSPMSMPQDRSVSPKLKFDPFAPVFDRPKGYEPVPSRSPEPRDPSLGWKGWARPHSHTTTASVWG